MRLSWLRMVGEQIMMGVSFFVRAFSSCSPIFSMSFAASWGDTTSLKPVSVSLRLPSSFCSSVGSSVITGMTPDSSL